MNPSLSDFIVRCTLGIIILAVIWFQAHIYPRDRLVRYLLPAIATLSAIVLIHLPRLPHIVAWSPAPVLHMTHLQDKR